MSKVKSILKWLLIGVVGLLTITFAFGYWFMSLIPKGVDRESLEQITVKDIPYLSENVIPQRGKVLTVVTSADKMGNTDKKTGYELTELSRAYYVFQANGFNVDIASPKGGEPSVIIDDEDMGPYDFAFLNDAVAQSKAKNTIPIEQINSSDYSAIYFVGGKGAMFDFPQNIKIQQIVKELYESNRVVGAVCHGPAALVNVRLSNGESLIDGKEISGFTNNEELFLIPDAPDIFPFLLQDKLVEKGAQFNDGIMYLETVAKDGNLITGQNPWSTWETVEAMVQQMGYKPKPRQITPDEYAVDVLGVYESSGYDEAKQLIRDLSQEKQPMNRTLLGMHSIVAVMQWRLGKFVNLLRLMSYAKTESEVS
ncbi:MAG: type 1 glutamine amidotransferase domain-containing protein [Cyclobacteriaceae bacterium]